MPTISVPPQPSDCSKSPIECPNFGSSVANFLAVGFERWYAEHAGVIPRIFAFCHHSDVTCCGYPLAALVWVPLEDVFNFAETIHLSQLALTHRAKCDLDGLIELYLKNVRSLNNDFRNTES